MPDTYEQAAQKLANKLATAESAAADVSIAMRDFVMHADSTIGPLTRKTFIREAQGIEGAIGRLHLDITPFDPRPRPRDGGGGK
ncbi:MAG: hypothetical protein ACRCS0_09130 [Albidovulum sp.]